MRINKKMFIHNKKPVREEQVFLINEQKLISSTARKKIEQRPWCVTTISSVAEFSIGT